MDKKKQIVQLQGLYDVLSETSYVLDDLVSRIKVDLVKSGFDKITVPVLESEKFFTKKVLVNLNLFEKSNLPIYKHNDGGENFVISPPGAFSLIRAVFDNNLLEARTPVKVFSYGVFPYIRRDQEDNTKRQYHMVKCAMVGDSSVLRDAQMIVNAYRVLTNLGFKNLKVSINNLGRMTCRENYWKNVMENTGDRYKNACVPYRYRPIQLYNCLKSYEQEMKMDVPQFIDQISEECRNHLRGLIEFLDVLDIPYDMEPSLGEKIGFSDSTIFEISSKGMPEKVLVRGGRYDEIAEELNTKHFNLDIRDTGSLGMEFNLDNILEMLAFEEGVFTPKVRKPKIFVVALGLEGQKGALKILDLMQEQDIPVIEHFEERSLKAQLHKARALEVKVILIVGSKEALDGTVIVRDSQSDNQEVVPLKRLMKLIHSRI
jgi:histidyl-tRNA synthetase